MSVDYKASVVVGVLLTDEQVALVKDDRYFVRMTDREVHRCGDCICGTAMQYVVGVSVKQQSDIGYAPIGDGYVLAHTKATDGIGIFNDVCGDKVTLDPSQIRMYIGLEVG